MNNPPFSHSSSHNTHSSHILQPTETVLNICANTLKHDAVHEGIKNNIKYIYHYHQN